MSAICLLLMFAAELAENPLTTLGITCEDVADMKAKLPISKDGVYLKQVEKGLLVAVMA